MNVTLARVGLPIATAVVALACVGCWGDRVPSLDRVGVVQTDRGELSILFYSCPGDRAEQVTLNLTDDNFEGTDRVLWKIQAHGTSTPANPFVVGEVPPGYEEVTPLEETLQPSDHVQVVVTSQKVGTIPMSFVVGDVAAEEVLVRSTRHRSPEDFVDEAAASCPGG